MWNVQVDDVGPRLAHGPAQTAAEGCTCDLGRRAQPLNGHAFDHFANLGATDICDDDLKIDDIAQTLAEQFQMRLDPTAYRRIIFANLENTEL